MRCLPRAKMPGDELSGWGVVVLAASVSFPVIGLDHFLRTSPAQFYAQPETEISHWIADSMMALPLFVIGVLAAGWVAGRARIGMDGRAEVVKRALLVTAACAVVVAPAWFQVDRTDDPVTAQPLVFPHASDSGDVYWVAPVVIITLTCVCLVPLAAWAGHRAGRGLAGQAAGLPVAIAVLSLGGRALRVNPSLGQPSAPQLSAPQLSAPQLSATQLSATQLSGTQQEDS